MYWRVRPIRIFMGLFILYVPKYVCDVSETATTDTIKHVSETYCNLEVI